MYKERVYFAAQHFVVSTLLLLVLFLLLRCTEFLLTGLTQSFPENVSLQIGYALLLGIWFLLVLNTTMEVISPDIAVSLLPAPFFNLIIAKNCLNLQNLLCLFITGMILEFLLITGKYMNEHIPDSSLNVIDAEGHFPHISAPEEVIRSIKQFLTR